MDIYDIKLDLTPTQELNVNCGDNILLLKLRTMNDNKLVFNLDINNISICKGLLCYANINLLTPFTYKTKSQLMFINQGVENIITYDILNKVNLIYALG